MISPRWLSKPVAHYRDTRSQLLLKLGFLWMRGESADSLLAAQLAVIEPMKRGLEDKLSRADGFDRTLALWRLESAHALIRFIETLRADDSNRLRSRKPSASKSSRKKEGN